MTLTGAAGITFVFIVDALNLFWMSQLGDQRLVAAIGFAFAIQFFSVSSGIGLMIAATALVSRALGSGDKGLAQERAASAAVIAFVVQILMAVLIITFRYDILGMAGARNETLVLAARYLAMTMPSLSWMAVALICSGVLRAAGDGRRAMFVTLSAGSFSLVVDPLLIIGLNLGLDGAAIGLNLSRLVLICVGLNFVTRTHDLIALPRFTAIQSFFLPFMAIAVPAILTQLATPFGNYVLTRVLSHFGDDAVAGWAVVGRLTVVAFGGIFSLAGAIGGIFGQNFGAGKYDRLVTTYRDAVVFCIGYTLIIWAILYSVQDIVADAFALPYEGKQVLIAFTTVGAGAFLFSGLFFVASAAFNTLGKPTRATVLTWIRDGALTWPLAVWMAGYFGSIGVIFAQALLGALMGIAACLWGWHFIRKIGAAPPDLDLQTKRGWRDLNRFRRR
ncbi:MAG: MATE family efflux transporter [Paracoccaceae bacterium]